MNRFISAALVAASAVVMLSACKANDTGSTNAAGADVTGNAAAAPTYSQPITSAAHRAPAARKYTVTQQNAIESANEYLAMGSGFSRAGLIEQLSSRAGEGFRKADALFAVSHIKVNWNQQAVLSAKEYLQMGGFSRASLIDQLSSKSGEQFTLAQATYAANHVGLR